MTAPHIKVGESGEDIAANFIQLKGYIILERNYRHHKAEVDIIALHKNTLVFIEVKTRSGKDYFHAEQAVSKAKQSLIYSAASHYYQHILHKGPMRFDVISVNLLPYGRDIYHFHDCFYPLQAGIIEDLNI
jgi:putative endonuclease